MRTQQIHHSVYVIKLDAAVLKNRKFREANPDYRPGELCLYVGMTGLTPEKRFENHKSGHKANKYVHKYGIELVPEFYEKNNPMTYKKAKDTEPDLAISLRLRGYAVWQK
jgi:hypothetical protein